MAKRLLIPDGGYKPEQILMADEVVMFWKKCQIKKYTPGFKAAKNTVTLIL